jgi:hypothetical protein
VRRMELKGLITDVQARAALDRLLSIARRRRRRAITVTVGFPQAASLLATRQGASTHTPRAMMKSHGKNSGVFSTAHASIDRRLLRG